MSEIRHVFSLALQLLHDELELLQLVGQEAEADPMPLEAHLDVGDVDGLEVLVED